MPPVPSGRARSLPRTMERLSLQQRNSKDVSSKDWTLPPTFIHWLGMDPRLAVNELVPKPANIVTSSNVPRLSEFPAFLSAMRQAGDILTENGAAAHKDTGSALVDLFFEFAPGVQAAKLFDLLDKAWKDDAVVTLKIVFHARSIHEGKGFKEGFFRALAWMWDHHPRTLLDNLHLLVDPTCKRPRTNGTPEEDIQYPARPHGSFDDLIDLLILHINGQLTSTYQGKLSAIDETLAPAFPAKHFQKARLQLAASPGSRRDRGGFKHILKAAAAKEDGDFNRQLWKAPSSNAKHQLLHGRVETALRDDKRFIALYITILHLFVVHLKEDLALLDKHNDFLALPGSQRNQYKGEASPHLFGMSYAAKWAPTPAHGADKQVLFSTALSMLLYPGEGVETSRFKLQKHVLTPLRKVLAVPEVSMSNGTWNIDYPKVPAKSMARNSEHFHSHDPVGFEAYLMRVATGELSISAASMQPHELLIDATTAGSKLKERLADLQWSSLVNSIKASSSNALKNCLAIADVSGSMGAYQFAQDKKAPSPIIPCIALTLLLGELASPPWNGCFFTFSENPTCEFVDPTLPLSKRAATLSQAHWTMTTNFYKVFDLILQNAQRAKLAPEDMIKKLFVFSDMHFNQSSHFDVGDTEHQTVAKKFEKAGYPMPEIVYWNLAGRAAGTPKPVTADVKGVALMSGFSGALMKYFLRGQDDIDVDMEEDDKDYEKVAREGEAPTTRLSSGKDVKPKKDPLQVLLEVVSAECFDGMKVVD